MCPALLIHAKQGLRPERCRAAHQASSSPSRHPTIVDTPQEFAKRKLGGTRPQIDASAPKDVSEVAQRLERFQNRIAPRAMPSHYSSRWARTISGRRRRRRRRAGAQLCTEVCTGPSAPQRTSAHLRGRNHALSDLSAPRLADLQNRGLKVRVLPALWQRSPANTGFFCGPNCLPRSRNPATKSGNELVNTGGRNESVSPLGVMSPRPTNRREVNHMSGEDIRRID